MITDEQLDDLSAYAAENAYPLAGEIQAERWAAYRKAHRAALEVDRESLRLLQALGCDNSGCIGGENEPCRLCQEQDTHVATLRKRLGLEQEEQDARVRAEANAPDQREEQQPQTDGEERTDTPKS